jgi:soluble lytic murein transglycosylase
VLLTPLAFAALAAFTSADATPYLQDPTAHAAMVHFAVREYGQAAQGLGKYLAKHGKAHDALQAELVREIALAEDGDQAAAQQLVRLAGKYPLLAPYCHYYAARGLFHGKSYADAIAEARKVSDDSPLRMDATLLEGDADRALGNWADAETLYAGYLDKFPSGIRTTEALWKRADAMDKQGKPATDLFMKVWVASPLEWGPQAEPHLDHPTQHATAQQLIARATVLFDAMRNMDSENAFAAALGAPGLDADSECLARFDRAQSVYKQRNRTRAAPLFEEAVTACNKTKNQDLRAKALYQLARCEFSKGNYEKSATLFLKLENDYGQHSYADDSRLRATEAYNEANEHDSRIDDVLKSIPEKYPAGDMKQEALWRVAHRAWMRGDYEGALAALDQALVAIPREDIWYAEGRSYYWKGRALAQLGKPDDALEAWTACARTYPLSYYALMALNRMREVAPAREAKLVRELAGKGHPIDEWRFKSRPLFEEAGFRRGVELARLGMGEEARREFALVGIRAVGKIKVDDAERRELLWLTAMLLDRASIWRQSHWIARYALEDDWHRDWPHGEAHKKWLLAYPRGYASILEPAAKSAHYPIDLLFAVEREESAFDPNDESFANAMGLLQMIIPTAKRFAKPGELVTRETLLDPVYNVQNGIRWLSFLFERFDHNPALAVAGHNAGDGAVKRWLHERGEIPLDEWIERIPYEETRNYTKRVMSTYFTYRWLGAQGGDGGDPVPKLGVSLPQMRKVEAVGTRAARKRPRKGKHK